MIPHIVGTVLTPERPLIDLLVEPCEGEPEVAGHPAAAELLGPVDSLFAGGPRLLFAPEAGVGVPLIRVGVLRVKISCRSGSEPGWPGTASRR